MGATIFDRKKLGELLENLAMLSGMGVSYWHPEEDKCIITTQNVPSPFCARLRTKAAMRMECTRCEQEALRTAKADLKVHYFTCHASLEECIAPIVYNSELLGFVMVGQILSPDEKGQGLESVRSWIEMNGFDFEETKKLYLNLPRISREKQVALLHVIEAIASFVHVEGIVRRVEFPLITRIEKYIDDHLTEPIALADVALALNMSVSTICHMLRAEKNTTLVKMINQKRVNRVCELLKAGKTVTSAAHESGFSSLSYCSRVFLQYMGVRPEGWRQIHFPVLEETSHTTGLHGVTAAGAVKNVTKAALAR